MLRDRLVTLAAGALFVVGCSDGTPEPTGLGTGSPSFTHSPSHPGEPLYELTLAPAGGAGQASLATDCEPGVDHVIADEWDRSLRAGGAGKVDPDGSVLDEDRFELGFTTDSESTALFGSGSVCMGNIRPEGDWRDDLIIAYNQRRGPRNPASVSVQWWFAHGEARYRLTVSSDVEWTWAEITNGQPFVVDGPYTLTDVTSDQNWFTAAEGSVAFEATAAAVAGGDEGGDGGNGGSGGDCPYRNPNHPHCR